MGEEWLLLLSVLVSAGLLHSSDHIVVFYGAVDGLHACLQRSEPDRGADRDAALVDPIVLQAVVVALEDTGLVVMPLVAEGVAGGYAYAQSVILEECPAQREIMVDPVAAVAVHVGDRVSHAAKKAPYRLSFQKSFCCMEVKRYPYHA